MIQPSITSAAASFNAESDSSSFSSEQLSGVNAGGSGSYESLRVAGSEWMMLFITACMAQAISSCLILFVLDLLLSWPPAGVVGFVCRLSTSLPSCSVMGRALLLGLSQ